MGTKNEEEMKIFRRDGHIQVRKGYFYKESNSVESHLLFAILQKLEEVRCGLIDLEPQKAEKGCCGECLFVVKTNKEKFPCCVRYPSKQIINSLDYWCGEFKRRK